MTNSRISPAGIAADRPSLPTAILEGRVIAIGRRLGPDEALRIGEALVAGGVRAYEVTLQGEAALDAIAALAGRFSGAELAVGAGTVLSVEAAQSAVEAGAGYLVMPHLDEAIVHWAADHGIPAIPGAATPTEVLAGWRAGAAAVKAFPASSLGPQFVRELRGPLPEIPLIPTGGVTVESAPDFLAAGAIAVGLGSWLTGDANPEQIRKRAGQLLAAIASVPAR